MRWTGLKWNWICHFLKSNVGLINGLLYLSKLMTRWFDEFFDRFDARNCLFRSIYGVIIWRIFRSVWHKKLNISVNFEFSNKLEWKPKKDGIEFLALRFWYLYLPQSRLETDCIWFLFTVATYYLEKLETKQLANQ